MFGMVLENVTRYDRAALAALSGVACRTVGRRQFLRRRSFLLVLGTLCLFCGALLLGIFSELDASDRVIGVVSFLMGLLALAEGIFYRRFLVGSARLREDGEEREYLFTGDFIQVNRTGVEVKYRYEVLLGAWETAGYFVLFLDSRQGMVVAKNGFTQGTADGLRSLLEKETGKPVEYVL